LKSEFPNPPSRLAEAWINKIEALPLAKDATRNQLCHGQGAFVTDSESRRYVDLANSFGSILLGHADPDVASAVESVIRDGIPATGTRHLAEVLAQKISHDCGGDASVAFFKTGTAAVRSAVGASRRATGRNVIVSAGYHGWDPMWAPSRSQFGVNQDGVFESYYVVEELERFLQLNKDRVAAAVISPDYVHLSTDQLHDIFFLCKKYCPLVVADEVKYGYRFDLGPSIHRIGLKADLYTFSKGLSNGWSLVGDPEVVRFLHSASSTLTYEASSLAASIATLKKLSESKIYGNIAMEGARFINNAKLLIKKHSLPIEIAGQGGLFQFIVGDEEMEQSFFSECGEAGLLLLPYDNQAPSWAFRETVVDIALASLDRALYNLANEFQQLKDTPLRQEMRWHAAWNQMEGFPYKETDKSWMESKLMEHCLSG
jgi:glutamate-1-semialdehyde aminotransferase